MSRTAQTGALLSPPVNDVVRTKAGNETSVSRDTGRASESWRVWQDLIDRTLVSWLDHPDELQDDGIDPVSETVIRRALDFAETYRDKKTPPPDRIVRDANGGILFERREGDVCEVLHLWDDGSVEYQQFRGTELVGRLPL